MVCLLLFACGEASLFNNSGDIEINAPIDFVQIPGTDIGLVLNSNVNLTSSIASIAVIDLTSNSINVDKSVFFPNFASSLAVDEQRQLILVGDRANDVVQVFDYDLGTGGIDQFSLSKRTLNSQLEIKNAVVADEEPSDIQVYTNANSDEHAIISNYIDGTITFLNLDNFTVQDLFPQDDRFGLPLVGLTAFDLDQTLLGIGAGRIALDPSNNRFAYVASFINNVIFTIDLWDREIEQTFSLLNYFSTGGLRDMLIDSNQQLYFLHQANDSLNKIDISQVVNNNILLEESPVQWLDQVSLPSGAEYMALSPDEQQLWVGMYDLNQVWVFDTNTLNKLYEISLDGLGPAKLVFSEDGSFVYVCEFLSSHVAVVDTSSYMQVGMIE
ncbi:MAG TPA: hypothetical protein PKC21_01005 [Oligoflexia bacterium]|nr:hypothetical protein [Oligoflexia bacterium]